MFTGMNPWMTSEFVRSGKTFLAGGKGASERFLPGMGAYVSCLENGQSGVKRGFSAHIPDARDEKMSYHRGDMGTCMVWRLTCRCCYDRHGYQAWLCKGKDKGKDKSWKSDIEMCRRKKGRVSQMWKKENKMMVCISPHRTGCLPHSHVRTVPPQLLSSFLTSQPCNSSLMQSTQVSPCYTSTCLPAFDGVHRLIVQKKALLPIYDDVH